MKIKQNVATHIAAESEVVIPLKNSRRWMAVQKGWLAREICLNLNNACGGRY